MNKKVTLSLIFFLFIIISACTTMSPILLYKDGAEKNPNMLPVRAGLIVQNEQIAKGINIKSGLDLFPILPLNIHKWKAEFPKGKESEFLSDMVKQYFVDSGIFEYLYQFPFKKNDVDIIVKVKFNKFKLKNNKFWNYLNTKLLSFIPIPLIQFLLPQEKFKAEYDISINVELPNGKLIKSYNGYLKGKESAGIFKKPYSDYIFYRSIFKKVFLRLMDSLSEKIIFDRDEIISSYKKFMVN